jgi:hypothetical protein
MSKGKNAGKSPAQILNEAQQKNQDSRERLEQMQKEPTILDSGKGLNVRKAVSFVRQTKKVKEEAEKLSGKNIVFEMIDKSRRRFGLSDLIFPSFPIFIPEDSPYKDLDGDVVHGQVVIKYIQGERSLFAHKQSSSSEKRKMELLLFNSGVRLVNDRSQKALYEFLSICPLNADSPYKSSEFKPTFRISNREEDAKKEMEKEVRSMKLVERVLGCTEDEVYSIAVVLGMDISLPPQTLRIQLKRHAEADPSLFEAIINDKYLRVKEAYIVAKQLGIISYVQDKVSWRDGNTICIIPHGRDEVEFMCGYFDTEQGSAVIDSIIKSVENFV